MKFTKNDEAVSPVIGVILMVAITVILAAVIAAFVFGMAGNISKSKVIAATAQRTDSTHVVVTYQGGQDAGSTQNISWSAGGAYISTLGGTTGILAVGCSTSLNVAGPRAHVVGVASFTDGSSQVVYDSTI